MSLVEKDELNIKIKFLRLMQRLLLGLKETQDKSHSVPVLPPSTSQPDHTLKTSPVQVLGRLPFPQPLNPM